MPIERICPLSEITGIGTACRFAMVGKRRAGQKNKAQHGAAALDNDQVGYWTINLSD